MILSAVLSLDAGGFTTPLGKVTQGLQTVIRLSGDLSAKLTSAFDMGGELSDLAAQTGELPSTLKVLQQAFADTGVGANATGQILAIMRRNMASLNDDGSTTIKTFQRLGLSTDALKNMTAADQLQTIGTAINGLSTPAEKSAAAMEIFGRSGAKMLTFFATGNALETAQKSLGELPSLLDRNANAFDGVSDAIKRIKTKTDGIWAGIAEGALPAATAITDTLDGIDLTGLGIKIGEIIGTTVELFRTADLGQLLKDGLIVGMGEAVNEIASMVMWLSQQFWLGLSTPLAQWSALFAKAFGEIMELLGKIPKVGKLLGLENFQAQSFATYTDMGKTMLTDIFKDIDTDVTLVDVDEEKARLAAARTGAADAYKARLDTIRTAANDSAAATTGSAAATTGLNTFDLPEAAKKSSGGGSMGIDTDQLSRIGGYTGGSSRMTTLTEQIRDISKQQLTQLAGIGRKTGNSVAVWGVA